MKVLDDEVPSGYFEALPNQTLARLEGSSMQQGTSSGTTQDKVSAAPPPVAASSSSSSPSSSENTEDSGLHDIRNLAQSTKQRLSSKRITTSPPVSDDIASSSAGWKAVALPQPAKMVALPELSELPSKKDIKAAEKAAAKERKAVEAAADVATAKAALAPVEESASASTSMAAATPARSAFQLPSQQKKKSKGGLIAIVGLGVAAAAGAAIYVTTQKKSADQAPVVAKADTAAPAPAVTATPIQQNAVGGAAGSASADVQRAADELAKQQAENDAMKAQLAAAQAAAPPADTGKDKVVAPVKAPAKHGKGGAKVDTGAAGSKGDETKQTPPVDKTDKTKTDTKPQKNADGSEPDFNDLLKEAGVDQNKKEQKPKIEKKSLTGDDFKKGMSAIDGKAHGCYKGTQGTATVKLTIAPSGSISKISVGGAFAGKPEAECVAAAVRGATFPAWDGAPMTFTYPILLSE